MASETVPTTHRRSALAARARALEGMTVTERRLQLAGVSTAILEAGQGPPLVALHGPGANATHWAQAIPGLARDHRVIAPDLPGHGESDGGANPLAWLGALIAATCPEPPVLVGGTLGGAIAARFACACGEAIRRLVLVDTLGLQAFAPTPAFGAALHAFGTDPTAATHAALWEQCAFDLDRLRARMGARWEPFAAYNVERAQTPAVQAALGALMGEFGLPALDPGELARLRVPTALIWGRHDRATPLAVAEAAAAAHGWPLTVIDDCADDPPVEQPEAFVAALAAQVTA
jgi:pimeloyl-ACP methyl ester carboxylesterase